MAQLSQNFAIYSEVNSISLWKSYQMSETIFYFTIFSFDRHNFWIKLC